MPRGRQYYDPEIQTDRIVPQTEDLARIELFPAGSESLSRLPETAGKWIGRRIGSDGRIVGYTEGDFDHDRALRRAQELWPGLPVYELNAEQEDSTWQGVGPSPRMWHRAISEMETESEPPDTQLEDPSGAPQAMPLHVVVAAQAGTYVLVDDVIRLLLSWADEFEENKNPSAALGLNEAVRALQAGMEFEDPSR